MPFKKPPASKLKAKQALYAQRDEVFAQLIASGTAGHVAWREACERAGLYIGKRSTLIQSAGRKRQVPEIAARIQELQELNARKYEFKREDAIGYLITILQTPIGQIDENHPLCEGKRITKSGQTYYWMPSKLGAMDILCRMMPGWLAPVKGELSATPEAVEMLKALRNGEELPKAIDVTPKVYHPNNGLRPTDRNAVLGN